MLQVCYRFATGLCYIQLKVIMVLLSSKHDAASFTRHMYLANDLVIW